jgi:ABC-type lipoprotein release transport system permease subunit
MYLKLAWRNLWRNKRRTIITLASVFFAVVLCTLMMSFKEGVYKNMVNSMVSSFIGYGQIQSYDYIEEAIIDNGFVYDEQLGLKLSNVPELSGHLVRLQSFALAISGDLSKGALLIGIDPALEKKLNKLDERITSGAFVENDENSVMLGTALAKSLKLTPGDTIVLLSQGYHGSSAAGKYHVKGTVNFGSPELSKQLIFLPLKRAQSFFGADSIISNIVLFPQNVSDYDNTVQAVKRILPEELNALSWEELAPELVNMIETDRKEGYVFMFILYIVISFGIFGTILMMLAERMREMGILISLGMSRIQLSIVILLEVLIISILGAFVGMIGAMPVCTYFYLNPIRLSSEMEKMAEEYGMDAVLQASLDPIIFIQQAIVVGFIGCIIACYPMLKIKNLDIIKAMRS